jgi:hypothetical protein
MVGVGRITVTAASTGWAIGAAVLVFTERTSHATDFIDPMLTQGTSRGIDFIGRFTVTQGIGRCFGFIGRSALMQRTGRCFDFIDRFTPTQGTGRCFGFIGLRASGSRAAAYEDDRPPA